MSGSGTTSNWAAANKLLMDGLQVSSTSTPALNGRYAVSGALVEEGLAAEASALALNNTAADGSEQIIWADMGQAQHTFTAAQFKTFLGAVNSFVAACYQYSAGITTTAPSSSTTIA